MTAPLGELVYRAQQVLVERRRDEEIWQHTGRLVRELAPDGANENFPAAEMLAKALHLTVGCGINKDSLAERWAMVAGALLPMAMRERDDRDRMKGRT